MSGSFCMMVQDTASWYLQLLEDMAHARKFQAHVFPVGQCTQNVMHGSAAFLTGVQEYATV